MTTGCLISLVAKTKIFAKVFGNEKLSVILQTETWILSADIKKYLWNISRLR